MVGQWKELARRRLLDLRTNDGWPYRGRVSLAVEPTTLAALALLATSNAQETREIAQRAGNLLRLGQNRDGSLPSAENDGASGWSTPLGIWLWQELSGFDYAISQAFDWLRATKGTCVDQGADRVFGHDSTIPGWPWIAGTHSWVEPTALAVIAIARAKQINDARMSAGVRMLLDRAIPSGGWNYGNPSVYGTPFRPQPDQTGIAYAPLRALSLAGTQPSPTASPICTPCCPTCDPLDHSHGECWA